ncbi:unnamed protein product [Owenia fusiformis]|uniref:Uncharacterized protein n=1 Tax=Owenia fusiformis TaxID=6347 RepID=A0A8J1U2J8_OWEFU|nr:unnamed protein product [Owenia fusiformis]
MSAKDLFIQPALDESFTKDRFKGKVVIVTGGASGIGKETARRFLNDGATVAIFDINDDAIRNTELEFKQAGFSPMFYSVDVSNKAECLSGVGKVADANGGVVHFLVNCAAYFCYEGLQTEHEHWAKTMAVNVEGVANMVQSCSPYMVKAGGKECGIVNIASVIAYRAMTNFWTYLSSKGAIISLTKCMALDLSEQGIRVNSISPGVIWTPEVVKCCESSDKKKAQEYFGKAHMLRRIGEGAEVAAAVAFLCSKDASFITATDLCVDGGFTSLSPVEGTKHL